jgi:hypothetical protein
MERAIKLNAPKMAKMRSAFYMIIGPSEVSFSEENILRNGVIIHSKAHFWH